MTGDVPWKPSGVLRPASQATLAMAVALASGLIVVESAPVRLSPSSHTLRAGATGILPQRAWCGTQQQSSRHHLPGGADGPETVFKVNTGGRRACGIHSLGRGRRGSSHRRSDPGQRGQSLRDNRRRWERVLQCGTVLMLNKRGKETVLYSFKGGSTDGAYPFGGVIRENAGNLYGATYEGGTSGGGRGIQADEERQGDDLDSFTGGSHGAYPDDGALVGAHREDVYGTTQEGGARLRRGV